MTNGWGYEVASLRDPEKSDKGVQALGRTFHYKDVVDFCNDRIGDSRCTACNRGDYLAWLYSPHADRFAVISSVTPVFGPDGERLKVELNTDLFMPVFYLTCNNCGHIRLHSLSLVSQWLNERQEEEDEGP